MSCSLPICTSRGVQLVLGGAGLAARPRHRPDSANETTPLDNWNTALCVTPAPDAALLSSPHEALEAREAVAIAFAALLQRLPTSLRAGRPAAA